MNLVHPLRNLLDIERIKSALRTDRDLLLFILGINTSLRISDLLTLRVSDVTEDYLQLRESKTDKLKRVLLNDSAKAALRTLLPATATPSDFLFPSRKGDKAISRVQAWRILNSAAKDAGLDYAFGTHSLRKTFAYHAYQNGTDLSLLMRVLNHSSQRETLRYIGIEQEAIDDVYTAVNL